MTGQRLESGGTIRRDRPIAFRFDGATFTGFEGDTLASALLASGVSVMGRSFRYHRPRGLWGAWTEEPAALVDLSVGGRYEPNARATLVPLEPELEATSVNRWPGLRFDLGAFVDVLHPLFPAGFYYKTFMKPGWATWEESVRARAGLGRVNGEAGAPTRTARTAHCDVLVIGGGPAGLAAARAAAGGEARVMLVDDRPAFGGSLPLDAATIDGHNAEAWAAAVAADLATRPMVTLLPRTTAIGYFDHDLVALAERRPDGRERLWRVRARRVVLATGAIERPLVFPDNDRPGIMAASAALGYVWRHGVLPGADIVVVTNNGGAYQAARALAAAGARIKAIVDTRATPGVVDAVAEVIPGSIVTRTQGRLGIHHVEVAPLGGGRARTLACDLVAVSGGWNPSVHLFSQSGGKLRWDEAIAAFVPDRSVQNEQSVGAARGVFDLAACLEDGHVAGLAAAAATGHAARDPGMPRAQEGAPYRIEPFWFVPGTRRRQWIDRLNDVTVADVRLAARENFASVEHLKRYTTLGMGTDQGKTSNVNGLAVLAAATGRAIPDVGTTTFRPPTTPTSFAAFTALRRCALHAPTRRLPAHHAHARLGAVFDEYGGWQRPACYPRAGEDRAAAIRREAAHPRRAVGLFDASSLGKVEVTGPDAARFLDLMIYNAIGNLAPGRVRYALMLNENGKVFDDGVVARLGPERFLLSPSSSHTAGVVAALEEWRQCEYLDMKVRVEDVTAAWGTVAVTGPRAHAVLDKLETDIVPGPHMSVAEGTVLGALGRIARVSYTGEAGFEISVPAGRADALWDHLLALGEDEGIAPFGLEALMILRMEKGYILIGIDTDGNTEPQDLGMTGPLRAKTVDFVGRRSLLRPDSRRTDRLELVGLAVEGAEPIPGGAHVLAPGGRGERSIGHVSSSAFSPSLGRPVALAMVEGGRARQTAGERVAVFSRGTRVMARIVAPAFVDREGARLRD